MNGSLGIRWRRKRRILAAAAAAAALALAALVSGVLPGTVESSIDAPGTSTAPEGQPLLPGSCLAIGAAVIGNGRDRSAELRMFEAAADAFGPFSIRRSFDQSLPRTFSESAAGGDADAGLRSFVSWKPPDGDHRGAAAGRYDDQIAAWARSVPRDGVFATAFHEPENDMSAAEFVAFHRHVYTVVKKANPTIYWGPVYMAYWWDPATPEHYIGDPSAWWPGDDRADFAALDWYGFDPRPMTTSGSFRQWYATMKATGVPLLISEYGQYFQRVGRPIDPDLVRARVRAIRQDADWLADHPRFVAWIYWQGGDAAGTWKLRDPASRRAWADVAATGCAHRGEQRNAPGAD